MNALNGIDILIRDGFKQLDGQRVGLITNHSGLTQDGHPTIDVLHSAPNVQLKALFGPEHGIRGEFDAPVKDSLDAKTGLPVYSLYGETMRPGPEQLKGLDALVYDIQDVGCRFYTFITTLGNALEEAAKAGIHTVVLDRPNPIGGKAVEGPVADADNLSFTAYHPIPVRHGMTVGELARFFNVERKIGAGLIVIPCEGWKRGEWWDETGLTWINPSPNMRSLTQALLYPGIGLMEFTNISVGRGTDTPFEIIGAPWLDGRKLAGELNSRGLPGVRFIPVHFTPKSSVHQGVTCGGVNFVITQRDRFQSLRTGLEAASALHKLFPADWKTERYNRLLANKEIYQAFLAGTSVETLEKEWQPGLKKYLRTRQPYLIYGE
jgi:uncharacterized protein YbbC (DUF1343 family)